MFSAMSDKSDCTELLVRSGAAVSNNTIDIFHASNYCQWYIYITSISRVLYICQCIIQVMAVDGNGQTALHWAALMVTMQCLSYIVSGVFHYLLL